ncbi:hypothetical protein GHK86_07405, partial [Acidimicrobiaceae bacterium USS-CC1]|nr:hypothetical protein [Acidiferrimicrobium australe]
MRRVHRSRAAVRYGRRRGREMDGSRTMIGRADEDGLGRLVGASTLSRGRSYAAAGAVLRREWDPSGLSLVGEVQGSASRPYRVAVNLRRVGGGAMEVLDLRCSCPVGVNCKHAVALLLAPAPRRPNLTLLRGGAAGGKG